MTDPRAVVGEFVASLDGDARRVASAEWGITLDAAGWPLHVGIAIRDGLLRAQAAVAAPGALNPHDLLRWNRSVPLVSFSHTRAGETWIGWDLPLPAVSAAELDRGLGLLVLAATQAREHAHAATRPASARDRGTRGSRDDRA
jgi:hypothetical protein